MTNTSLDSSLEEILEKYARSFAQKTFADAFLEEDDLMLVFGLTQQMKAENKQYWGRELGMCWQRLIVELCQHTRSDYAPGIREGADEICDLVLGHDAIDTKYRVGSGDSGTLKKFRQNAFRLQALRYNPVLLILRNDNLPQAIAACTASGWHIQIGQAAYQYIYQITNFDLAHWLQQRRNIFPKKP